MKYFKLFVLFFILANPLAYSAETNNTKTTNNTKKTYTQKAKKKIVRKMLEKKKKEGIKAKKDQLPVGSAYNISNRTINIKSPMCQYAIKNNVIALKKSLLASNYSQSEVNTVCSNGESLLMLAIKNNNYLTAKLLIEKGADVNLQNIANVSPLHIIARMDSPEIDKIFALLIHTNKLNINLQDKEGYTPIMRAIDFEKISMIEQLVKLKADLIVKNNYGLNAVDMAKKNLEGKKTEAEKSISEYIIKILDE